MQIIIVFLYVVNEVFGHTINVFLYYHSIFILNIIVIIKKNYFKSKIKANSIIIFKYCMAKNFVDHI